MDEQCASNLYEQISAFPNQYKNQANLNPLFYIRLVGPAIVIGKVKRTSFRNFTIEFTPRRPGHYLLDVVVEFSSVMDDNSLAFYKQENCQT
ncbi:hypothetical protein WJX75_006943 [Coccomyxa subellipsoidea]|uniref:Velvet domain-containing protein n=1 Tax=Coccomyxa subellipsoidea TaxID=248742 RepID=A0ABR2Z4D3_9CHLO